MSSTLSHCESHKCELIYIYIYNIYVNYIYYIYSFWGKRPVSCLDHVRSFSFGQGNDPHFVEGVLFGAGIFRKLQIIVHFLL